MDKDLFRNQPRSLLDLSCEALANEVRRLEEENTRLRQRNHELEGENKGLREQVLRLQFPRRKR